MLMGAAEPRREKAWATVSARSGDGIPRGRNVFPHDSLPTLEAAGTAMRLSGCPACQWLGEIVLVRDSEVVLNSLHAVEQVREQVPVGWCSLFRGDGFKIAGKILRRDPK